MKAEFFGFAGVFSFIRWCGWIDLVMVIYDVLVVVKVFSEVGSFRCF